MHALMLLLLAGCPKGGPPAAPAAQEVPFSGELDGLVTRYRQAIVLASDAHTLPEEQRRLVPILGKVLLHENLAAQARLNAALDAGDQAAFLTWVESDGLHDADKLVFEPVLSHLAAGSPHGARAAEDHAAIEQIRDRYADELSETLGQFGTTRGMVQTREKWDDYLDVCRKAHPIEQILEAWSDELEGQFGGVRGKAATMTVFGEGIPKGTVVLTFDDGPHRKHTPAMLDILEQHDAKAVFFEVGKNVTPDTEALTRRILDEGHMLGNHSWQHKNLPKLDEAGIAEQIDRGYTILEQAAGVDVLLFRPPYGGRDDRVYTALEHRNTKAYLWNVDSMDWADPVPESIARNTLDQVAKLDAEGKGALLLFHDVHPQTVEAMGLILGVLDKQGFRYALFDGDKVIDAPPKKAPEPQRLQLYNDSWAVVIGINSYKKWPRLNHARRDAEGLAQTLIDDHGFSEDKVLTLYDDDATKERILAVLGDELPAKVGEDDGVLVFFAGHGTTRKLPNGRERGYIVPVDADTANYTSTAISMTNLQDISDSLAAKHVFFVMDACYSGIALTRAGSRAIDPRRYLSEVTSRTARQILTAGGAEEEVADHGPDGHSIFTWNLLRGLDGQADLNGDGFIAASELSQYVAPRVSAVSRQTPAFGNLVGGAGGEFVFALEQQSGFLSGGLRNSGDEADIADLEKARRLLQAKSEEAAKLTELVARMQEKLAEYESGRGGTPTESAHPAVESRRYNQVGLELYRGGQYAEALRAFEKAAELDDGNAEAMNNVGFLQMELGNWDQALPWLERTLKADPQRAVAYLNLADTLAQLGRREEAVTHYQTYLEHKPHSQDRGRVQAYLDMQ